MVAALGGKILTIVPSTVGKIKPMGSPEEEWRWAVEGLKECQAHAEQVGVRLGHRAAQPLRDLLPQPRRPGARAGQGRRRQLRRRLDIFHMNIEEDDRRQAIRDTGAYLVDFHVADNNRMPCGQGAIDWEAHHRRR